MNNRDLKHLRRRYERAVTKGNIKRGEPLNYELPNGERGLFWECTDPDCPHNHNNRH